MWPVVGTTEGTKDRHLEMGVLRVPRQMVLPTSDADCLWGARQGVHRRAASLWVLKPLPQVSLGQ